MTSKLTYGVVFGVAALVLSLVMLEHPGRGRGASSAAQMSSNVAVVRGSRRSAIPAPMACRACRSARRDWRRTISPHSRRTGSAPRR